MTVQSEDVENSVNAAHNDLYNNSLVSFVGKSHAGKTVVAALFKHALFNRFLPQNQGKYNAIVTRGQTFMNEILEGMLRDEIFPPITKPMDNPFVEISIYKLRGKNAGKTEVIIRDMSGENHIDYLEKEYDSVDERLSDIILHQKTDIEKYGPLAYLLFSRMYIFVIDCAPKDKLEYEQSYFAQTILNLTELHKRVKIAKKKMNSPIAIIFTKSDMLQEDPKSADELLEMMPEFKHSLEINCQGPIKCFKMSIQSVSESDDDVTKRVRREMGIARQQYEKGEEDRKIYNKRILNNTIAKAKAYATEQGADEEATKTYVNEQISQTQSKLDIENPAKDFIFDETKHNTPGSKIKKQMEYSDGEYVKLISWILANIADST